MGDAASLPYLDETAAAALEERRRDLGELLGRKLAIQSDEDCIRWWTFAGGKINHTLKNALEWRQGWKIVADNFRIRIGRVGVSDVAVREAIRGVAGAVFWQSRGTAQALLARVPEYRLSKFQDALPEAMALEMVGAYPLDVEGAQDFVADYGDIKWEDGPPDGDVSRLQ